MRSESVPCATARRNGRGAREAQSAGAGPGEYVRRIRFPFQRFEAKIARLPLRGRVCEGGRASYRVRVGLFRVELQLSVAVLQRHLLPAKVDLLPARRHRDVAQPEFDEADELVADAEGKMVVHGDAHFRHLVEDLVRASTRFKRGATHGETCAETCARYRRCALSGLALARSRTCVMWNFLL
eukprot:3054084-Prymnesium_polylepis.1